jgi:hypothetical protein
MAAGCVLGCCVFALSLSHAPVPQASSALSRKGAGPISSVAIREHRLEYPYSVIPGGVQSAAELRQAVRRDVVVAAHYAGFDIEHARIERVNRPLPVFVSYRRADRVYWTRKRLTLLPGETIITDGIHSARTRCGNRIADSPEDLWSAIEPSEEAFEAPTSQPKDLPPPYSHPPLIAWNRPSATYTSYPDFLTSFGSGIASPRGVPTSIGAVMAGGGGSGSMGPTPTSAKKALPAVDSSVRGDRDASPEQPSGAGLNVPLALPSDYRGSFDQTYDVGPGVRSNPIIGRPMLLLTMAASQSAILTSTVILRQPASLSTSLFETAPPPASSPHASALHAQPGQFPNPGTMPSDSASVSVPLPDNSAQVPEPRLVAIMTISIVLTLFLKSRRGLTKRVCRRIAPRG